MPIFGYSKCEFDENRLGEMREISFDFSPSDLRRIAHFLSECARGLESGELRSDHYHIDCFDRRWGRDHPNSDIIVLNSSAPEPPRVFS